MKQATDAIKQANHRWIMPQLAKTNYVVWTLLACTLVISTWAIVVRGAAVEWLFAVLCVVTFVTSYILPRLAIKHIGIERTQSNSDTDALTISINIKRKWRIPGVWYATIENIINESELSQEPILLQQHYDPLFHKTMSQQYFLGGLNRGQYKSEAVTLVVGDLLGLTTLKKSFAVPIMFTITPELLIEQDETFISKLTAQKWTKQKSEYINGHQQNKKTEVHSNYIHQMSSIHSLKPYSEGDSIHRIYYHALSRGMGVHVFEDQEQLSHIKQVIFLDQYVPPMSYELTNQQFNTLIGWVLDHVSHQLVAGPILLVTDNWCYECYEQYQLEELKRLFAQIRPDVQHPISERLHSLAKILPSHCALTVYTTDWKSYEGWTELAQLAWHKKATVTLQLLSEQRIMTYTMREQQRELEQSGLQLVWRFSNLKQKELQLARKGSERYAFN